MATSNTLTNVIPQILAQGLDILRENAVMPRLVNRDLDDETKNYGDTITVPIPSESSATDVTPGPIMTTAPDMAPSAVNVTLDFWKKSWFTLSDKELEEAISGTIPMHAQGTLKALANSVDSFLLGLYTGVYSAGGSAGTTPFATTLQAFQDARKAMNKTLAPMKGRKVVLGSDAEGNAIGLPVFQHADKRGDQGGVIEGEVGYKVGADWFLNQNVDALYHTAGTAAGVADMLVIATTTGTGTTSMRPTTASTTHDGSLKVGDLFTVEGDTQQYVISGTVDAIATTTATVAVSFIPDVATAWATNTTITFVASHVPNLYFHPNAFAWASRPMNRSDLGLGNQMETVVDDVSGIALRLEVSRENKQTSWVWDVLGGGKLVRAELASRILG